VNIASGVLFLELRSTWKDARNKKAISKAFAGIRGNTPQEAPPPREPYSLIVAQPKNGASQGCPIKEQKPVTPKKKAGKGSRKKKKKAGKKICEKLGVTTFRKKVAGWRGREVAELACTLTTRIGSPADCFSFYASPIPVVYDRQQSGSIQGR
jgi:hypothetical protein